MPPKSRPSARSTACLGLVATAVAVLAACDRAPTAPKPVDTGAISATSSGVPGPDAKPGLTLDRQRLVLPAVRGNPGALYFTVHNAGAMPTTIATIHVDGAAAAEMHMTGGGMMAHAGPVVVPAGGTVIFAPGARHVMVFKLSPSLVAGGQAEMTLVFADGDKLSVPVPIGAAGSGGSMPAGMKM